MDPHIVPPPARGLTPWRVARAVIFLSLSAVLLIGGLVALVRGDGLSGPLLVLGAIFLVLSLLHVWLLARLHRMDHENRFGTPLR